MNATNIDHILIRNRSLAGALISFTDAITPPPSVPHRSAQTVSPTVGAPSPAELREIHDGFYAPVFRALESYGDPPRPAPTLAETIAAGRHAMEWHGARVNELNGAYHAARLKAVTDIVTRLEAFT